MYNFLRNKVKIIESKANILDTEFENKSEIEKFEKKLKEFRIDFEQLALNNPKKFEYKKQALAIGRLVPTDEELINFLYKHKKLPLKSLVLFHGFDKKIIKKHEKYIIGICVIVKEDYTKIAEFMGLWEGFGR